MTVQELVQREVHYCVSLLARVLAQSQGSVLDAVGRHDLSDLCKQAFELAAPVEDWESAAREWGWEPVDLDGAEHYVKHCDLEAALLDGDWSLVQDTWREACESDGIEPYYRKVHEFWLVTDWLADKLISKGEKVDKNFAGMCIWARTATGSFHLDAVLQEIAATEVRAK